MTTIVAAVAVTACANDAESTLDDTTWRLDEAASGIEMDPPDAVTLRFHDGRASGMDVCNSYSGPYEASGTGGDEIEVRFGPLMTNTAGCRHEGVMTFTDETARLTIERSDGVAPDRLVLRPDDGSPTLHFVAQ